MFNKNFIVDSRVFTLIRRFRYLAVQIFGKIRFYREVCDILDIQNNFKLSTKHNPLVKFYRSVCFITS